MRTLALLSIGLAALSLFIAYVLGASLIWALVIAAVGILWLMGAWRDWNGAASVGLIAFVSAAAFGIWQGLPASWMLVSTILTLAAWDLDGFALRLQEAGHVQGELALKRSHLERLLIVAGLGLLLGGMALGVRFHLGFWWDLVLGLLVMICLSQVFRLMRREAD